MELGGSTSQAWLRTPQPSQGFLCLFPPELLKLDDFRGRPPKLPTLHMVRDYITWKRDFQPGCLAPWIQLCLKLLMLVLSVMNQ